MTKLTRQYLGILAAIAAYHLVHEGAHFLCAILMGTFKSVHFMGIGMIVVGICLLAVQIISLMSFIQGGCQLWILS